MDNWFEQLRKAFADSLKENLRTLMPSRPHNEIMPLWDDGLSLFNEEKYEEAIAVFSKVLKLDPDNIQSLQQRIKCYMAIKKFEQALIDVDKIMYLNGHSSGRVNLRGLIYWHLNMYHNAMADFTYLIDIGYLKEGLLTHRNRASCAFHIDKTLAIHDYTYLIEMEKDVAERKKDHLNRGYVYFTLGDFNSALGDFMSAIEIDNTYTMAYRFSIEVYIHQNNYNKALDAINKCLEIEPNTAEYVALKGKILTLLKQFEAGEIEYHRALELDSSDYVAHNNLAFFHYSHTNRLSEALYHATIAIERSTPIPAFFDTRAQVYWLMGDYDKALADFDMTIRLNNKGLYLAGKSITTLAMGDTVKAIELWCEAIRLDETLADPSVFDEEHHYAPLYVQAIRELAEKAKLSSD